MDTERRREELEKKRLKLAELRRAREERRASSASAVTAGTSMGMGMGTGTGTGTGTASSATGSTLSSSMSIDLIAPASSSTASVSAPIARRPDLDALVSSLLDRPSSASSRSPALSTSTSEQQHSHIHHSPLSSIASSPIRPASAASEVLAGQPAAVLAQVQTVVTTEPQSKPTLSLQPSDIVILDLPPVERVVYSKEMQTDDIEIRIQTHDDLDLASPTSRATGPSANTAHVSVSQPLEPVQVESEAAQPPPALTEEEIRLLITSSGFSSFVDASSRLMEKALTVAEQFDFLRDYTIDAERTGGDMDLAPAKFVTAFGNDQYTKGRTISSLTWNPRFPELFAAAYTKSVLPTTESDGLVLVWNLLMPTRPEFVLTCQSEVRTIRFSDFHPHLIIGGTYSGQVALWDTRSKLRNPVLKTPLSASGHTHPVTCCALVGTEHAHQLLTSASDGTICAWQLDMLAQPQEILELHIPPAFALMSREASNARSNLIAFPSVAASAPGEVGLTCFALPPNETSSLWIGTEHGTVYHVSRYDRASSKAGVVDHYAGHSAPVTALAFHSDHVGSFSDLFLTCSMDWTIKLWRIRKPGSSTATAPTALSASTTVPISGTLSSTGSNAPMAPMFSFLDVGDYVFDVAWSPVHPAVFASVDGSGHLDLWNLNQDTELYVSRVRVAHRALNKVTFSKDGRRVLVGSADGQVYQYDLADHFLPHEDDWIKFQHALGEMEALENERRSAQGSAGAW